jgi:hypothetical protein
MHLRLYNKRGGKMKYFKKAISMLLACTVFMSSSFSAFAETNTIEKKTEEELKQVVRGSDEDVAAAPNGRFIKSSFFPLVF